MAMRLSPVSTGLAALGDCRPHPLSVLQALLPAELPSVDRPTFRVGEDGGRSFSVGFEYRAAGARALVEVELRRARQFPRPASLAIDGRHAERHIRLPEYALEFRDADRSVPVPDPLTLRIEAFVASLDEVRAGAKPPDPGPILARMTMIESLVQAYRLQVDEPGPRTQ